MLTEQRIIKSITHQPEVGAVNVQWANQILRDGEFVSETYERKVYTTENSAEFLVEVENADKYATLLGWTE